MGMLQVSIVTARSHFGYAGMVHFRCNLHLRVRVRWQITSKREYHNANIS